MSKEWIWSGPDFIDPLEKHKLIEYVNEDKKEQLHKSDLHKQYQKGKLVD